MAIPTAFTETRDKLQRTRKQGNCPARGVQRKRHAPVGEVVHFHGKWHVRQQVTKSLQRVHKAKSASRNHRNLGRGLTLVYFVTVSSRGAASNGVRELPPATQNPLAWLA